MSSKQHMTPAKRLETLVAQGVKDVFGIVGSAFMDALDLFPAAGIRFVPTVHEQGAAHMADYSRVTAGTASASRRTAGHHQFRDGRGGGLLGAQPGGGDHARDRHVRHGPGRLPGNRAVADLLAHHQVPGACEPRRPHGRVHGQGFRQRHGRARPGAAEHSARLFLRRDRRGDSRAAPRASRPGAEEDLEAAARLLAEARFPVIVAGGGVLFSDGQAECVALAELLGAPVVTSYLHNDVFPSRHPCGAARWATRAPRPA